MVHSTDPQDHKWDDDDNNSKSYIEKTTMVNLILKWPLMTKNDDNNSDESYVEITINDYNYDNNNDNNNDKQLW